MVMNAKRPVVTALLGFASILATACGGSSAPHGLNPESPAGHKAPSGGDALPAQPGSPVDAEKSASSSEAPAEIGARDSDDGGAPAPPPTAQSRPRRDAAKGEGRSEGRTSDPFNVLPKPKHRPGLATSWGEQRSSRVSTAPFTRANRSRPFAIAKLFYNDAAGIRAMSDTVGGFRNAVRSFPIGGDGHLDIGLRDGSGRFLTGFAVRGDNFVTASAGSRYTIVVRNNSPGRVEAVVSVDGLDVIDGKAANFRKRGYLIDPFGDVEIDGFRTSNSEVAAFRFGSVRSSYAARKHGSARNVGVIGIAAFHERGDSPRHWRNPRSHEDVRRRNSANPFPGQFATPPN
jgi:hypothetical protein